MSASPNNPERQCQSCGEPLPKDAPQGLCPKCLGQAALDSGPGSSASAAYSPTVQVRPTAPKIADITAHFPQLEILELLGQGGMGVVYKARQPKLDRLVALKILPKNNADPAFAERFQREARALAKLSHPNIVAIHDVGETGGFCYFLMEYVDGMNLRQLQRAKQLTPEEALAIVPKICEALQFAHDEGIVHRDIKPENILVDKKGRVKIADFGLAKLLGKDHTDKSLTGTEQIMGTPHYMAPEQMEATHSVDHRADIYSLGVVFYEMLTGSLPRGRFEAPSKRVQVDVRVDEVVLKTLEYSPDRRYQHASEVKTQVENISQGQGLAAGDVEAARQRVKNSGLNSTPSTQDYSGKLQLAGIGLLLAGIADAFAGLYWAGQNVHRIVESLQQGWFTWWLVGEAVLSLGMIFVVYYVIGAALFLLRREDEGDITFPLIIAALVPPGFFIGLPAAIYAFVLLSKPEVKAAFKPGFNPSGKEESLRKAPPTPPQHTPARDTLANDDFLLCNPRLPRMAQAITVFALIIAPVLYMVDLFTLTDPPSNVYAAFVESVMNLVVVYGGFVVTAILFVGGLKLRQLRPAGPGFLRAGLWLSMGVLLLVLGLALWSAVLQGDDSSSSAMTIGEAFLSAAVIMMVVLEVTALVWLHRNKQRLAEICRPASSASVEQGTMSSRSPDAQALAGKAKWGAICAVIGFLACLTVFTLVSNMSYHLGLVADGEKAIPDRFWPVILVLTPFCVIMPVAATMLGWQAIRKIRTSGGQSNGVGLALFAGLLFPLLLLDAAVAAFCSSLADFVGGMFHWDYRTKEGLWGSLSLLACAAIDYALIIRAWNSVSSNADGSGQPAATSAGPARSQFWWKWAVILLLLIIGLVTSFHFFTNKTDKALAKVAPKQPSTSNTTTTIRETPPNFGHVTHDGRFCDYALEAPVNHRVNVWIEWWQNGRRITLPDFDLADSFTPAKGKRFKGYLDFVIVNRPYLPNADTNAVQWRWGLRGDDALTGRAGIAKDPFAGLPKRDSSYGHQPAVMLRSGEEVTLLVVRGDADQLEGQPWDPAMAGRADMEMHLKARIDAVPEGELGELSQSGKSIPAPVTSSSGAKEPVLSARIDAALAIRTDSTRNNTLAQLALEAAGQGLTKPAKRAVENISFVGLKDDTAAKCAVSLAAGDLAAAIEVANLIAGSSLREATLAKLAQPKP